MKTSNEYYIGNKKQYTAIDYDNIKKYRYYGRTVILNNTGVFLLYLTL